MLRRSAPWRCGDVEIRCFGAGLELHPVNRAFSERLRSDRGTCWMQRLRSARMAGGRKAQASARVRWQAGSHRDFALIKFRLDETERRGFRLVLRVASATRPSQHFGIAGVSGQMALRCHALDAGSRSGNRFPLCQFALTRTGASAPGKGRVAVFASAGTAVGQAFLETSVCRLSACGASVLRNRHRESRCKVGFRGIGKDLQGWRFGAAPAEFRALRRAGLRALDAFGRRGGPSLLGSGFRDSLSGDGLLSVSAGHTTITA
jgi:hypothetical protein